MSLSRIASRYAKSFIDLAVERNQSDKIMGDMNVLKDALSNRDLYLLAKSPIVKPDKKSQIFTSLFEGKVDTLTMEFLKIIIRKGREVYLPEIVSQAIHQYKKMNNVTSASLTTAVNLSSETVDEIEQKLQEISGVDGQIDLEVKTDEEILGGFILEIESQLYDTSVKNQLSELKKDILDNTYIKSL